MESHKFYKVNKWLFVRKLNSCGITSRISVLSRNSPRYLKFVIVEYVQKYFIKLNIKKKPLLLIEDQWVNRYLKNMRWYLSNCFLKDLEYINNSIEIRKITVRQILRKLCGLNNCCKKVIANSSFFLPEFDRHYFTINGFLLRFKYCEHILSCEISYKTIILHIPTEYILNNNITFDKENSWCFIDDSNKKWKIETITDIYNMLNTLLEKNSKSITFYNIVYINIFLILDGVNIHSLFLIIFIMEIMKIMLKK